MKFADFRKRNKKKEQAKAEKKEKANQDAQMEPATTQEPANPVAGLIETGANGVSVSISDEILAYLELEDQGADVVNSLRDLGKETHNKLINFIATLYRKNKDQERRIHELEEKNAR